MIDYFKNLLDLLEMERKEDEQSYRRTSESSSVIDRRTSGITWYPVAIRGSEIGRGDYITVELERTTHQYLTHQFRFGVPVALFSNHNAKTDRLDGIVSYQSGNQLKVTFNTDELPEWHRNGKLGIDLLFDDNSYDEMVAALKTAGAINKKDDGSRLIKILTGEMHPSFHTGIPPATIAALNNAQQAAVTKILSASDLAIIHGPPGTGKTTTLVQAIKALIHLDHKQILVVAPSNTAVDLLSEKLFDEGLNVLRVGNPARVSERLMSLTLDSKTATHARMKEMKHLKKRANEFRNMAHKYKRSFGKAERDQRKALFDEAHKIMKEVNDTEQYIIDDLISRAEVITATLVGSNHYTVKKLKYHTVVIDEAGQSLEPAAWIPILKAQKLVLAGDHNQLSPTVKSFSAAKSGLSRTLLEKNVLLHPEAVVLLEEQYRMNEIIMAYSSRVFYDNALKAHPSVAYHLLFAGDLPLEFVDTAGCGFEEKMDGSSCTNPDEAVLLFKHLNHLVTQLKQHDAVKKFPTIAVISPYKQQVHLLKEQFLHAAELQVYRDFISVNTIDSFQGQERDIVYISMTRSNAEGIIGFLSDTRRMNVAMTRARKKLVVIGDSSTLSRFPFYLNFIDYAEKMQAYKSAWEFVNE